ncbi:MAG: uracil-DNA glycosylase [Desulfobacteraceae bacterium]|nr:uracil-DNA glycosylase [Desulfobacteraceae bacterium]
MEKVRCAQCEHFFITWIAGAPYGCTAWGVKSRRHPFLAVRTASGFECQLFKPKPRGNAPAHGAGK